MKGVKLLGIEYSVKFTLKAQLSFEDQTGKQMQEAATLRERMLTIHHTLAGANKHYNLSFDEFVEAVDNTADFFEQWSETQEKEPEQKKKTGA